MGDSVPHTISVRLPPELRAAINEHMAGAGTTVSQSVRIALEAFFSRGPRSEIENAAVREGIVQGVSRVNAYMAPHLKALLEDLER